MAMAERPKTFDPSMAERRKVGKPRRFLVETPDSVNFVSGYLPNLRIKLKKEHPGEPVTIVPLSGHPIKV